MSTDTAVEESVVVALQPPSLWKVVLLNDDSTPMELVIELLTDDLGDEARVAFEYAIKMMRDLYRGE